MWTLLFDIDGTLIQTGGAGMHAIRQAMHQLFGVEEVPQVPVHGRTDFGIISELFKPLEIDAERHMDAFNRRYWELLPASLNEVEGAALPGVVETLERFHSSSNVSLGILTG